jgi:hypothetical protein
MSSSCNEPDADDVLIIGLHEMVQAVRSTLRPAPSELTALLSAARSAEFRCALTDTVLDLEPYCREPEGIVYVGPSVSSPGQRTVTVDRAREPRRRVGLHVDSWDAATPRERAGSRRRLCVNAGEGPRYLLFVAARVSSLAERLEYIDMPVDGIATRFLRAHPDHPVVRVRIDPGEAYVASTEDLIHDGSTLGAMALDLALHFMGHFGATADGDLVSPDR